MIYKDAYRLLHNNVFVSKNKFVVYLYNLYLPIPQLRYWFLVASHDDDQGPLIVMKPASGSELVSQAVSLPCITFYIIKHQNVNTSHQIGTSAREN